jgi:hypothetical protein
LIGGRRWTQRIFLKERVLVNYTSHTTVAIIGAGFKGKDVTVIGCGQSALETAALLSEGGAFVRVVVRKPAVVWNSVPRTTHRSLYQRLRHPVSNLGEGLQLWLYCTAPILFRYFPQRVRLAKVKVARTTRLEVWPVISLRKATHPDRQLRSGSFPSQDEANSEGSAPSNLGQLRSVAHAYSARSG